MRMRNMTKRAWIPLMGFFLMMMASGAAAQMAVSTTPQPVTAPGTAGATVAATTPAVPLGGVAVPAKTVPEPPGVGKLIRFAGHAFQGAGAPFMWAILLVSGFAAAVAIEKGIFLYFRAGERSRESFDQIIRLVRDRRIEEARALADRSDTPFGRIAQRVLRIRHGHRRHELQNLIDEAYLAETPVIQRRLPLLAVSANISTLLGLLGTIVGLILAFEAVASVAAAQRTAALAGGISVAMATTGFGLLVAIPTLAMHGLLGSRADRASEELETRLAVMTNLIEEWNKTDQASPYEETKMGIAETEKKIAEYVTAGE